MSTAFLGYFKFLARQAWIDKGIRTLLAVTPGLGIFLITGNKAGVAFAFSALCLSAPYADRSFRPIHLIWLAPVGAVCMTVAVWLQDHPALYIPVFGVIGGVSVLVQRSGRMPGRITIWFLVYVLYQSSELRDSRLKDTIAAALWVAPAAVWTYVVCFWLWPPAW